MFDLGWQEFILVAIITVIVVGPKDLPRVVRSISQWVRKARSMAREFQNSLEEVAREAELDDVRREVQSISKDGIGKSLEKQIDEDGSMRAGIEDARKSANTEEIEADLKALDQETRDVAAKTPASPPVETAEDYAAKSVAPPAKDSAAKETPAATAPAEKAPAAKAPAKAATAKTGAAKTGAAKKAPAKKPAAKKPAAAKAPARKPSPKTDSASGAATPADPEKPRSGADGAASGQG